MTKTKKNMAKLIGTLILLGTIALGCGSSETTVTPGPTVSAVANEPAATTDLAPLTDATPAGPDEVNDPIDATPVAVDEPAGTAVLPPTAARLPADPNAPSHEWVAGVNAAGWDFHRHLEGNAVSSPMSIGIAFSLSRAGASADTGAVLDGIFGFPAADTHGAANAVGLSLAGASVEPTVLEVANRLFPDDEFSPLPEFLDIASSQYGAGIQPIDTAQPGPAADAVNRWVSDSTRGLIPTIVSEDMVDDQKLILVNTVYLKADWAVPFLAEWTDDGQFTTADGGSVTVPFMRDYEPLYRRYVRLGDADAVELPYEGGELAMWLIVPRDVDGLAAVEESFDAEALAGLRGAAREGYVDLAMPKWEQTLPPTDLFEWLCPREFCPGAGFDNIAPGIFITGALHGAKVIVDEKGTEAAAATAMGFAESATPEPDLTVVADRPFLWAITHQDTGAILFVGRLVNPAA